MRPSDTSPISGVRSRGIVSPGPARSLQQLLEGRLDSILRREGHHADRLFFYDTGFYWVCFERSAYHASRHFPDAERVVLHRRDYPFYVVMAIVSHEDVRAYGGRHLSRTTRGGRMREFLSASVAPDVYGRWHREVVATFFPSRPEAAGAETPPRTAPGPREADLLTSDC